VLTILLVDGLKINARSSLSEDVRAFLFLLAVSRST
jgi:hypothetical protein